VPSDCPTADPYPPVVITVKDGLVIEVMSSFGRPLQDLESWPTIDIVYADVKKLVQTLGGTGYSKPEVMSVNFDTEFHYQTRYAYDLSPAECDGKIVTLTNFRAL
jgi:hypothetical protein